jgi:hypothetical protein
LSVFRLVDNTHSTTAQLFDDAVMRDGLTDHLRECYGVRSGKSMYGLTAVGSEEARLRASLRPPLKLHVRFSRMQLSRRLSDAGMLEKESS